MQPSAQPAEKTGLKPCWSQNRLCSSCVRSHKLTSFCTNTTRPPTTCVMNYHSFKYTKSLPLLMRLSLQLKSNHVGDCGHSWKVGAKETLWLTLRSRWHVLHKLCCSNWGGDVKNETSSKKNRHPPPPKHGARAAGAWPGLLPAEQPGQSLEPAKEPAQPSAQSSTNTTTRRLCRKSLRQRVDTLF